MKRLTVHILHIITIGHWSKRRIIFVTAVEKTGFDLNQAFHGLVQEVGQDDDPHVLQHMTSGRCNEEKKPQHIRRYVHS